MPRLNRSTESTPFTPKLPPNFQSKRGSVGRRMRMASAGNIGQVISSPDSSKRNEGAYGVPALAGKMRLGDGSTECLGPLSTATLGRLKPGLHTLGLRLLSKNIRFRIVLMKLSKLFIGPLSAQPVPWLWLPRRGAEFLPERVAPSALPA